MWMLFLLFLIPHNEAIVMRVHQGAKISCNDNKTVNYVNSSTWKSCIKKCADTEECMVAHTISGNPYRCYMCSKVVGIRKTVNQKDQIALKTTATNKNDCDLFENGSSFGTFNSSNNLSQYQYTTKRTKTGWLFNYNITKYCPPNWQPFQRTHGLWCIQVSSGTYNRTNAIAKCQELGATLTALETDEERNYIWEVANGLIKTDNHATIWIDGQRRKGCQLTSTPKVFPPGCDSIKGFDFMDKVFNTNSIYAWEQNNPDGLYDSATDTYQDCLTLWIRPNNALIDDVLCVGPPVDLYGYACGKLAG